MASIGRDNGVIFAAYRALQTATALNLAPFVAPMESPKSNGMAEAFVSTFKRYRAAMDR
jgi:putative transposase